MLPGEALHVTHPPVWEGCGGQAIRTLAFFSDDGFFPCSLPRPRPSRWVPGRCEQVAASQPEEPALGAWAQHSLPTWPDLPLSSGPLSALSPQSFQTWGYTGQIQGPGPSWGRGPERGLGMDFG